nr:AVAST type 2 anti-phage system protein Avs2 [Flavobacterium sp. WG21]
MKNLGPRFNKDINFKLPIAKVFNDIAKDDLFFNRFLNLVDNWILEDGYRKMKDNLHLDKIESNNQQLKQKVTNWIKQKENSVTDKIDVDWILNSLDTINSEIDIKIKELYKLQRQEEEKNKDVKKDYSYREPFEGEISRLREINRSNDEFINNLLTKVHVNLANNPFLIIKGDAGNGKSHLLGDISKDRISRNLPTLLLLGQHFVESKSIWENIYSSLSVTINKKEIFLDTLNNIGKQIGSRVLILIDAINEGAGADLWESQISGFIDDFNKYPFIGIVLSIRTTYLNFVIPENVHNNPTVTFKEHEGFKGNEYEALRLFCNFHELKQPHFPILSPEFSKPLFLQLICNAVKDLPEKAFPQGFQGMSKIFEVYINAINLKFQKKREEYKYTNAILDAIHKIAFENYNNENKYLLLKDVRTLLRTEFPEHKFLLNDLIEENIFITNPRLNYETDKTEEIIYFAYQRFGDFYIADELLKKLNSKLEVINAFKQENDLGKIISRQNLYWYNDGILEAFSILLPEKFNLEIFEVCYLNFMSEDDNFHKYYYLERINRLLLDSLNWRKIESIDDEKLIKWLTSDYFNISDDDYFNKLSELSTIIGHPFNSDRLSKILKRHKMPERDSFWQQHLRYYTGYNDDGIAYPIRRLIDWAWTPNISEKLDFETTRLTAQALIWVLASTRTKARDESTKALVNLLEQQPDVLIWLLKNFEKVNDPYISERLYAIAYGCILRTAHESSVNKIALTVYNLIFKKQNPPQHILLRDYARNTIEFALYKNPKLKVDPNFIRPPYKSKLPEILPNEKDILKYNFSYKDPDAKRNYKLMNNRIYDSVTGWGDFGKHIDSCLDDFAPTSFTFELEYKQFYKSITPSKRKLLKEITLILELKSHYNKSHYLRNNLGIESLNQRIDELNTFLIQYKNLINEVFQNEEKIFITNKVIPFLESKHEYKKWKFSKSEINSFKYWIIERTFKLGYDYKIHGQYDDQIGRYNYGRDKEVERIGKKYQKIALHEILAKITDNYKLNKFNWHDDKKYEFYKGAWQMYIRDIDPAFIEKNIEKEEEEEEDNLGILNQKKEWWEDSDYKYWNQLTSEWIEKLEDLPNPLEILEKRDLENNDWLCLKKFSTWDEPKPMGKGKYDFQRKEMFYKIQGYLVNNTTKKKIIKWLSQQNFWGNWMPESSDHNHLINREKFWSPAYFDSDNEKKWQTIRDTNLKVIIATTNAVSHIDGDKSGAQFSYEMPCKTIFEEMNLNYAPVDGEFKNNKNQIIATNKKHSGVLIRKKDFLDFLNEKKLDVIWTIMGEKMCYSSKSDTNYRKELSGVYYLEDNQIKGIIKAFESE